MRKTSPIHASSGLVQTLSASSQRTERNIVSEIACQLVMDLGVALSRNRADVDADRSATRYRVDVQSTFDRADIERRAAENGVPGEIEIEIL
jgi:hypothetical protein